ncbi:Hypothetical protein A7982_11849 [Minicystis rosea]|nr:Hypothetical protein A7982_11849 [Minicystis rosea]
MRTYTKTVFNDFVVGTGSTYTTSEHNKLLGSAGKIAFQVVGDQVSGTSPTLTLQIEHSSDGRNWSNRSGTAEINAQSLSSSATNVLFASDAGATPLLGFVRLRIALGGTSPNAHVKITAVGRDNGSES